jgi:dipeptidyl aminopeptidase/acylaminoacyl peptidase
MAVSSIIDRLVDVRLASSPLFSKDGQKLFHLADDSGQPQVWVLDLNTGARRQLTHHDEKVAFLARSPADDTLVYGTDLGGDERQQLHLLPADGGRTVTLTTRSDTIHTWGAFSPDGARIAYTANARDGVHFDLHVMNLADQSERVLLELSGLQTVLGWSADGGTLAVVEHHSYFDHDLRLIDVATGQARLLPRDGLARFAALRWRKDGTGFFCLSELGGEHMGVVFFDLATASFRPVLMPEDGDVETLTLSPDNTRLAVILNRRGWSELMLVDAVPGEAVAVDAGAVGAVAVGGLPPCVIAEAAWSPDSGRLAFSLTAPALPRDLWMLDIATGAARAVLESDTAGLDRGSFIDWQLVDFPTFDGRHIPAWFALPPGPAPSRGRGAVVWVHGGPEGQTRPVFRADMQAMLAAGHAVLLPNVRGSTGYGRSYAALDDVRLRLDSVEDLRHARMWLGRQEGIDSRRIAVMGQSYGGFMVLATLSRHPELWKAGIEYYGIAHYLTLLRDTGPWRRNHRAVEYGDPERDGDFLHEISPLTSAHRILVPLLVAHGLRDPRVPSSETDSLVADMSRRGQPVETVIFEHEGHGFTRPDNRRAILHTVLDFLSRHL